VRAPERVADLKKDLGASASVVSEYIAPAPARHLPQMLVATTLVAVLPLAASLTLRASGLISSGWLSVAFAITLSLGASTAGSAYWRKHGEGGEVLFSELLLWGWIRRWRQERELANATRLLQLVNPGREPALTVERREQLLRQLAGALEGQDVYLNGHSRRVARHATMIARGMGLPNEDVARIRAAAAVHDVGKLRTPKAILNKPGRLTDVEFEVIKRHPVDGAEMVAALGDPELTRIVRHHHERLDGAGYPDRLRGDEIPVGARIIAVADTFDAITSARPYRDAAPHQKAIDILRKEGGTQLDPDAVRAFLAHYSGNRPALVWAIVTSSLRRIVSWLTGDPAAAATISAGKVAAATAATAAIGVVGGTAPVPFVHSVRAVPLHHVAAVRTVRAPTGHRPLHASASAPASSNETATRALRARGARGAMRHGTAAHRRAAHHATNRSPGHSSTAKPAHSQPTSAGHPAASARPAPSTASGTVPNSSAGGAVSRPTTTNPAGHVNHASSTGSAARNGQAPHSSAPGHSGSTTSHGNSPNGNVNAQHAAAGNQRGAGRPSTGAVQATGSSQSNSNAQATGSTNPPRARRSRERERQHQCHSRTPRRLRDQRRLRRRRRPSRKREREQQRRGRRRKRRRERPLLTRHRHPPLRRRSGSC
jgi:putative nucleotidyltransferase with HDIG domain